MFLIVALEEESANKRPKQWQGVSYEKKEKKKKDKETRENKWIFAHTRYRDKVKFFLENAAVKKHSLLHMEKRVGIHAPPETCWDTDLTKSSMFR